MKELTKERLDHLSLYMPALIYSCLPIENYPPIFISQSVTRLMGYKPSDFINIPNFWADHIHSDDKDNIFYNLKNLFIYDKHSHTYRFQVADGSYKWFQDDLTLYRNEMGEPIEIFGCMVDITQQKKIQNDIFQLEIKNQIFDQRVKLLQDMHDGFGSQLAIAQLKIREKDFDRSDIENIIHDCILDLHLVCDTLSQDNISLEEALINFKYRLQRSFTATHINLQFTLNLKSKVENVIQSHVLNILRTLQEAITNAIRHSKCNNIFVFIEFNEQTQEYIFSVKDDGIGMPDNVKNGRGLNNIQARLQKMGADFKIINAGGVELLFKVSCRILN